MFLGEVNGCGEVFLIVPSVVESQWREVWKLTWNKTYPEILGADHAG